MKKVCIILCIVTIAFILCISQLLAAPCGDTNSDGSINIADALLIAQFSVGGNPANFDQGAADVNGDGNTNIADALLVAQYYVGIIDQLSCQTSTNPGSGDAQITLNSNSISVSGSGATASGNKVTITSAGIFNVSGSISNGQIIVDTQDEEKVEITLNSVSITCSNSAPINIKNGEVKLTLVGNNTITDGTSYVFDNAADEEPNAAIFSKDDLTINGDGSLTLRANFRDGINCNDDLKISSGTINITAADDGMVGNESIEVNGGNITVNSSGDCLKVTDEEDTEKGDLQIDAGTLNLTSSSSDGLKAYRLVEINDGTINITTGTTRGCQGIKSDVQVVINGGNLTIRNAYEGIESTYIQINGGNVSINAVDDGINATNNSNIVSVRIEINGGTINVTVGNGDTDAFDSNGDIIINDGIITVVAPTSAFDVNGTAALNGGTVKVNGQIITEITHTGPGGGMGF